MYGFTGKELKQAAKALLEYSSRIVARLEKQRCRLNGQVLIYLESHRSRLGREGDDALSCQLCRMRDCCLDSLVTQRRIASYYL